MGWDAVEKGAARCRQTADGSDSGSGRGARPAGEQQETGSLTWRAKRQKRDWRPFLLCACSTGVPNPNPPSPALVTSSFSLPSPGLSSVQAAPPPGNFGLQVLTWGGWLEGTDPHTHFPRLFGPQQPMQPKEQCPGSPDLAD